MRRGSGDPDLPSHDGEGFLAYLHRLAQDRGYIPANVLPPSDRKRPKRHGQRGAMERIDAIFGIKAQEREPGEDKESA